MQDLVLFITGLLVGTMNAVAGGGMLIGFPVLLATGMPALIANATSSVIVLPGLLSSVIGYRKYLRQIPRSYLILIFPSAIGAAIGASILRNISVDHFERLIPGLIFLAVSLFIFQPFLHNHAHHHIHGPKKHRERWQPVVLLCIAFFPVSVYGGFFGTGFGFIMLAFLGFTRLHEMHRMNALKSMLALCITTTTLICLFNSHLIDWRHGLVMSAGTFIGGYFGARGAQRVSSHSVRLAVILIGLCSATYLAFRSY
jgi:hypothetical protein